MSVQGVWSKCLAFLPQKPVVVQNSAGRLSSDAGLLVVREFDERIGLTQQFAAALSDRRRQPSHSLLAMVRQRVYGLLAGDEDQNDHDTLRYDPVFQLVCVVEGLPAVAASPASAACQIPWGGGASAPRTHHDHQRPGCLPS